MVEIREVPAPEGMKDIFGVARSAWGMESPESFVADMLNALKYHGGLILGAYEGSRMVGFQYAFIGRRKGLFYIYSHMTGVLQEKKYEGIGNSLKQAQRRWARENGFPLVAWTYDPLMSLNSSFNLRKLGVIARSYRPNFYGIMTDSLNFGVETDRLVAEWWVDSDSKQDTFDPETVECATETELVEGSIRRLVDIRDCSAGEVAIEIPADFVAMKKSFPELAVEWRMETRRLFTDLFSRGYVATSFTVKHDRSYYLLRLHPAIRGVPEAGPFSD